MIKALPFPTGDGVQQWAEKPADCFRTPTNWLRNKPLHWRPLPLLPFAGHICSKRWEATDLGDVIPDPDCGTLPPFVSPKAGSDIEDVLIHGRTPIEINQERIAAQQNAESPRIENDALLRQIRRMIWFMCTGQDRLDDYRLCYRDEATTTVPTGYDAVLVPDGDFVEFRTCDKALRRRSRMAQRLGLLAATTVDRLALA